MKKLLILLFFIFPLHAEILSSEDLMYSFKAYGLSQWPLDQLLEAQEDKTKTLNIIDMKTMKMYYVLNEKDNFYNYEWLSNDNIFVRVNSQRFVVNVTHKVTSKRLHR